MKQIEFKKPVPLITTEETNAVIKVEEIELKTSGIKLPSISKTEKQIKFGLVIYTSYEDKYLIGRVVEIDPWRTTPVVYNGQTLFELPIHKPIIIVEEEEQKKKFNDRSDWELEREREALKNE